MRTWIRLTVAAILAIAAVPVAVAAQPLPEPPAASADGGTVPAPVAPAAATPAAPAFIGPQPAAPAFIGPQPAPSPIGPPPTAPVAPAACGPVVPPCVIVPVAPPPVVVAPAPAPPREARELDRPGEGNRTVVVIKLVLGLSLLFAVAYIGAHRRVVALERRLGISGIIAAGFPFVALGVIARQPEIGLLTGDVLERIRPILHFGLGWLGFIIGAQLDIRLLDRVPRGTGYLIVVEALVPFAATATVCGGLAFALGIAHPRDPVFWRDLILLGAAAAMTAPRRFRGFANRSWREGRSVDLLIGQLDEIVGVIGLLFVAAYFRPADVVGWQIPGTAWVFVTIGLGVVLGVLIFAMVRVPESSGEFLAVVLGSVAFGAGLAGYLALSPIVVCFIAGALVNNLPCEQRDDIFRILNHLERPIHLLFLIVAGASWNVTALQPWLLVPAFVFARIAGKWLGVFAGRSTVGPLMPPSFTADRVLVSALSPLSIALVLSLHGSAGGLLSDWIITVVIGGAILTEVAVHLTTPASERPPPRPPRSTDEWPVDDLDGPADPIYASDDDDSEDVPLRPRPQTLEPPR